METFMWFANVGDSVTAIASASFMKCVGELPNTSKC